MAGMNEGLVTEDGGLKRLFAKQTFDGEKYVKNIVRSGDLEISKALVRINAMTDETSTQMKRAVFENYNLFIDAGKAVSLLESNMHQMHHHLNEQKRLLNSLSEMKLFPDTGNDPPEVCTTYQSPSSKSAAETTNEEDSRTSLASLLERVEGSSSVAALPGRRVLFEGDLWELDAESFAVAQKVHVFLLNDSLLITTKLSQRKGPLRYKFQALYELDSLAVVNLREREGQSSPSNAFKIMVFPDTRVFQTESPKLKKEWMEVIDKAKRKKASENSKRRESTIAPPIRQKRSTNPFEVDLSPDIEALPTVDEQQSLGDNLQTRVDAVLLEEWLVEAPEDLDVCIAERNFAGAVDLAERVQKRLSELTSDVVSSGGPGSTAMSKVNEYRVRIDQRVTQLTDTLQQELLVGAERHGGVRSVRNAVTQLIRLGKAALACELFLGYRSSVLAHQVRQVKQEGSQNLYVVKLSFAFHRAVFETGHEFKKVFAHHKRFIARLCTWCMEEADKFADQLRLILIDSRSVPFYAMALAVDHIHAHSEKVTEALGVDMTYNLDHALKDSWQHAAEEQARVLKDAIDLRATDERWKRIHFTNPKESEKFFKEMRDAKITEIDSKVSGGKVNLAANTCLLVKSVCLFAESLARLTCRELTFVFVDCVTSILKAELRHYKRVLGSQQFMERRNFIVANLAFLQEAVLPKVEKYLSCGDFPSFVELKRDMHNVLTEGKGYSV